MTKVIKSNNRYSSISNQVAQDVRLSWKARGIFLYLWSQADNWTFYASEVEKHAPDGATSLRTGLNELEKYGYLKRDRNRDDKGQLQEPIWILDAEPNTKKPTEENPIFENQRLENQTLGNQTLINTNSNKNKLKINTNSNNTSVEEKEEGVKTNSLTLQDGTKWNPTSEQYEQYCDIYGEEKVIAEFKKMEAWLLSNPDKRKTKRGMARFVNGWLSRAGEKQTYAPREIVAKLPQWYVEQQENKQSQNQDSKFNDSEREAMLKQIEEMNKKLESDTDDKKKDEEEKNLWQELTM